MLAFYVAPDVFLFMACKRKFIVLWNFFSGTGKKTFSLKRLKSITVLYLHDFCLFLDSSLLRVSSKQKYSVESFLESKRKTFFCRTQQCGLINERHSLRRRWKSLSEVNISIDVPFLETRRDAVKTTHVLLLFVLFWVRIQSSTLVVDWCTYCSGFTPKKSTVCWLSDPDHPSATSRADKPYTCMHACSLPSHPPTPLFLAERMERTSSQCVASARVPSCNLELSSPPNQHLCQANWGWPKCTCWLGLG